MCNRFLIALVVSLSLASPPIYSQSEDLPDIGSPSDSVLSKQQEAQIGRAIYKSIWASGNILTDPEVQEYVQGLGQNAATLATGTPGVLQGCYSIILQDKHGNVQETHSISAGLDYSGVGPEHALLQALGRVTYIAASDDQAMAALEELCELEGILTALETAHAYAAAKEWSKEHPGKRILIGNSGRGDKDMPTLTQFPVRIRSNAAA